MHHDLALDGHGIRLVPLAPAHAPDLAALVDDGVWAGMTSPVPSTPERMGSEIAAALDAPGRLAFAVLDATTGEVRGSTSFYDWDPRLLRVEIGHTYYGRVWWGTSTNPACKLQMLTHAFETWGVQRVAFRADSRNLRSVGAITRLGAVPEGVLRSHRLAPDGTRGDSAYFSILPDEWPSVRDRLRARLAGGAGRAERTHLLLIGGRSGVGKTTVANALHAALVRADVRHAVVEGDALDLAHPPPWSAHLAERNLAAVWRGYRSLGYRRLVVTGTVSVLQTEAFAAALGDLPRVTAVLLTADDATAHARLAQREVGDELDAHVRRSDAAAVRLDDEAPGEVVRVATDGRTAQEVAAQLLGILGWGGGS